MADAVDALLRAYVRLTGLAGPIGRLVVERRRRRGKEHPERWPERLGRSGLADGEGAPVWIHAASVGETVAILPLVERIVRTGVRVVVTTVTTTSAEFLARRLPPGAVHQFVPLDLAPFVDRFLDRWRPQLAVFVESEVWPVAIQRLAARDIPLVVSNARMSDRSFARWNRVPSIASAIFGRIGLCLAQSEEDARRFDRLGVRRSVSVGNIKFDAPVPTAPRALAAALVGAIGSRPVWLAASTHPGEEELVLDAHERLLGLIPDLLLVIAPRHPERGSEVMSLAVARRHDCCQRGAGALPGRSTTVYVADTVGELGTFYRLAPVAFVGGSLVPVGGHNPIEPAGLGTAVVTGPHVGNFTGVYQALKAADAVAEVDGATELAEAVERLVLHTKAREHQCEAASRVVSRFTGALDRTWSVLEPKLARLMLAASIRRQGGTS